MPRTGLMNEPAAPSGLFDWARRRLFQAWRDLSTTSESEAGESAAELMADCLDGRGGEVRARSRAARLAAAYVELDAAGQKDFLRTMASFDAAPEAVAQAYQELEKAADPASQAAARAALRRALEPPRLKLLRQFTTLPDGVKFLVDLRATLLKSMGDDPALRAFEADFRGLLASWFDVGFLELRRIDWSSPASLLERLVGYEAVHEIRSWRDLKNRLDSDRRCYAFFLPRMRNEPLIFVEVALVQGMSESVQKLLDPRAPVLDPHTTDTAIFYSISNCQRGLSGISFGNFLIKRVAEELAHDFRHLKTFATLSPMPGFRHWVVAKLAENPPGLFTADEETALRAAVAEAEPTPASGAAAFHAIIETRGWYRDPAMLKAVEPVLRRLAARYLLGESRGKRALDPVAHFHLTNGARLERINVLGDISEKGVKASLTVMVNYLYDVERIEAWHEDYVGAGKRNASTSVRKLLRGWSVT